MRGQVAFLNFCILLKLGRTVGFTDFFEVTDHVQRETESSPNRYARIIIVYFLYQTFNIFWKNYSTTNQKLRCSEEKDGEKNEKSVNEQKGRLKM